VAAPGVKWLGRRLAPFGEGISWSSMPASDDLKRCTKCGEEKARLEFSRDRSRKDGRFSQCKACVMEWRKANAERLKQYNNRWRQANRDKARAQDHRYRERKRQEPEYRERRRANARRRDRERPAQDPAYLERRRANNRRYRARKASRALQFTSRANG
jgi:hypothetical protein